jgi:hypothetical protein
MRCNEELMLLLKVTHATELFIEQISAKGND